MDYTNYLIRSIVISRVVLAIIGLFIINFYDYKAITILLYFPFILLFFNYSLVHARTYIKSIKLNKKDIEIYYSVFFKKKIIVIGSLSKCSMEILRDRRTLYKRFLLLIKIEDIEIIQYEVLNWNKEKMQKLVEEFNEKKTSTF